MFRKSYSFVTGTSIHFTRLNVTTDLWVPSHLAALFQALQYLLTTHSSAPKLVFFFLHWSAGTSPREIWTSTKALSPVGDCPSQCSPGACGPWPRGAKASSAAGMEVCLPDRQMGDTPVGSLGVWCWIPRLSQGHFRLGMDANFLLWRWGQHKEHLALL